MVDLTPTEDLVLEVLAARHRLGETLWTFESRHAPAARRLEAKGLVNVIHGVVENTIRLSLTEQGKAACLSDDYTAPVLRTECPAFYILPDTAAYRVDCDRKRRHRGRHRVSFDYVADGGVTWFDDDEGAHGADPLNPVTHCPGTYPVPGTSFVHRCDRRQGHGAQPVPVHRTDLTGEGVGDNFYWTDSRAAHADGTSTACTADEPAECPHPGPEDPA